MRKAILVSSMKTSQHVVKITILPDSFAKNSFSCKRKKKRKLILKKVLLKNVQLSNICLNEMLKYY